jgi:hypothetical protein
MWRNMTTATRDTFFVVLTLVLAGVAVTPAQADDKDDIIGRWDHPTKDDSYLRFNDDGTFKAVAVPRTIEGKYRFLGKEVIEFDTPGIIYGRNKEEIRYRLSGDTLALKIAGEWLKFKRVK